MGRDIAIGTCLKNTPENTFIRDIGTWVSGCFAEKTVEKEGKKGKQIIYHRRQVS